MGAPSICATTADLNFCSGLLGSIIPKLLRVRTGVHCGALVSRGSTLKPMLLM